MRCWRNIGLALVSGDMFFETICSCVMNCDAVIRTIITDATTITCHGWKLLFQALMKVSLRGAPRNSAFENDSASAGVSTPTPPRSAWIEASFSTENRPKKIGICSSSGRHDESGLVPVFL